MRSYQPYPHLLRATFVHRPNRFVVHIAIDGVQYKASMGNPGRMQELLFPDTTLLVIPMDTERVTHPYRVVGVMSDAGPLLLDTIKTNNVAAYCIDHDLVPSLSGFKVLKAEVTVGNSRFDFLLVNSQGEELYCEVKSCSLIAHGRAMFPDAVTTRGARHTAELGHMAREGINTAILFMIQSAHAHSFVPDFHNDPHFAQTLYSVRREVQIIPLSLSWSPDLLLSTTTRELPLDWSLYEAEGKEDRGGLLFLVEVSTESCTVAKGYYCAVSLEKNLAKKVAFLRGRRKGMKSTIEKIRAVGKVVADWPLVRHDLVLEEVCAALEKSCGVSQIESEGETIYYFKENPLRTRALQRVLLEFRMLF